MYLAMVRSYSGKRDYDIGAFFSAKAAKDYLEGIYRGLLPGNKGLYIRYRVYWVFKAAKAPLWTGRPGVRKLRWAKEPSCDFLDDPNERGYINRDHIGRMEFAYALLSGDKTAVDLFEDVCARGG